jgi:exosortase A
MKVESASVLQPQGQSGPSPFAAQWRIALPILLATIAAIILIHWRTFHSIVAIWERSETFAHGFLIAPISIALIWMKRREVAMIRPSVDYLGFALLAAAGLVWLVSHAGQVQVIAQYAVVAMIPAAVIAVCGRQVAGALAFPLAFLMLGVPIGEGLIPPLMDLTADFTVAALRFTGIPVFREGNFFTIPSGSWSVVEGCSGVRYLIASITVGTLFAYLNYRLLWKRVLFIALSVIVPLVANWLRAYMIVMIGHLSDGKLAHGVDHLIYGWVFFGIVMMLLFWAGSFWRDEPESRKAAPTTPVPATAAASVPAVRGSGGRLVSAAIAAAVVVAAWPLYAAHLDRDVVMPAQLRIDAPIPVNGWTIDNAPLTDWRPRYEGASTTLFQVYRKGDAVVALYLGYYPQQREGAKLVTSTNIMVVQKHPVWSNVGESSRVENAGNGSFDIRETRLRSPSQRLLVWDWFRIAGRDLTSPYIAKVLFARDRLLDRGDEGVAIILATPYDEGTDAAQQALRSFTRDMLPSVNTSLARVSASVRSGD